MAKKKVWKAKRVGGFQPVMIDLEVHKAIEAARESFAEPANAVLRRLLGLAPVAPPEPALEKKTRKPNKARAAAPSQNSLPDGAELRAEFRGTKVCGAVRDGAWVVNDSGFSLPAAALIASLEGSAERLPELEGWDGWEVRLPGGKVWKPLAADVAEAKESQAIPA